MPEDNVIIDMRKAHAKKKKEISESNDRLLQIPDRLKGEERRAYEGIVATLKNSISYKLEETDLELIWQYCMLKIMRDTAWSCWIANPEKYVRIVTGIASDGKTPKVVVKENEHYKILGDSNKQLEKILRDLRLTPDTRIKNR